ncbi:uncharacterized protein Bfra_011425 [Botrytis fragariae]|uniref:Uncharacterized protein n=1 Tax=Botrytis fragariae TaxID=1964551 RepID=A0A8H6AXK8_9HELO|nr:uncharacterized protein Bfra_011425 [Botrytis fragariae]KAF5875663.1 hypothetical protein Bfra_011425 [Botrytis fragariae]
MSYNNRRSHPPSTPSTTASTSSPETFSEQVANLISRYELALPQLALAIDYERNSGLDVSEHTQTLFSIYRKLESVLTSDSFRQEDERLQQRGRMIVKDTLLLHRTFDLRGAEAAVEKYHLRQFY